MPHQGQGQCHYGLMISGILVPVSILNLQLRLSEIGSCSNSIYENHGVSIWLVEQRPAAVYKILVRRKHLRQSILGKS